MTSSEYSSISTPPSSTNASPIPNAQQEANKSSVVPSVEHSAPITELMTAVANLETDAYVRIFDGDVAPLNGIFVVERKELVGKTPEEIQTHFSLTFVPRMICDANFPLGAKFALGKLTNASGNRVSVFRAITALNLSTQRPLTPENIAPVPTAQSAISSEPAKAVQTPYPEPLNPSEGFNIANAQQYLLHYVNKNAEPVLIPNSIKRIGPDGFPYVAAEFDAPDETRGAPSLKIDDDLRNSLVQSLLKEGMGLAVFRHGSTLPMWAYTYGDIMCLNIFGGLRPQGEYDPNAYPGTIDAVLPPGVSIRQGRPSDQMLPSYARRVIADRISAAVGQAVPHEFYVFEIPQIDTLRRLKLVMTEWSTMSTEQRREISKAVQWCLPYALYVTSSP